MGNYCLWIIKSGNAVSCLLLILLVEVCVHPATVAGGTTPSTVSTSTGSTSTGSTSTTSTLQPSSVAQPSGTSTISQSTATAQTGSPNTSHSVPTTLPPTATGNVTAVNQTTGGVSPTTNSSLVSSSTSPDPTQKRTGTADRSGGEGQVSSTTPKFENVSCVGNETGCPEYKGHGDATLPTGAIVGIAVGAAVIVIVFVSCLVFCCRKRQSLSGSKADLSNYWDDNVTLSYINGHIDFPKDQPDEMISLDNDSFLNSLDNMSFTNVWTAESAKHTNF